MSEILTENNNKRFLILGIIAIIVLVVILIIIKKKRTKSVQNEEDFKTLRPQGIEEEYSEKKEEEMPDVEKAIALARSLMGGAKSVSMEEFKQKAKEAGFKNIVTGEVSGKPMESLIEMKAKPGTIIVGIAIDNAKKTRVVKILDAKL